MHGAKLAIVRVAEVDLAVEEVVTRGFRRPRRSGSLERPKANESTER